MDSVVSEEKKRYFTSGKKLLNYSLTWLYNGVIIDFVIKSDDKEEVSLG